jgi:hypothetical protein
MASITIAAAAIYNWQLGSDVQLRIYALESFYAADGFEVAAGNPSEDADASSNFYGVVACTVSGSQLNIPSFTLESTTDSPTNPSARYGAYFYTLEGQRIGPFGEFASFSLPSTPTSTTWGAIEEAQ